MLYSKLVSAGSVLPCWIVTAMQVREKRNWWIDAHDMSGKSILSRASFTPTLCSSYNFKLGFSFMSKLTTAEMERSVFGTMT